MPLEGMLWLLVIWLLVMLGVLFANPRGFHRWKRS